MKKCITTIIIVLLPILILNSCRGKYYYDKISPNDYVLSPDGLTLLQWFRKDVRGIDFQSDPILSKVTNINENTFSEFHYLKSVILPKNLTEIKYGTFRDSALENIVLTNSIKVIGKMAFGGCESLTTVCIPEGVSKIDEYAFINCVSLEDITIPNSVTYIGDLAFEYCTSLKKITISSNLVLIGASAFKSCYSLRSISIPNKVIEIGNSAFEECSSLTSLSIPNSVTEIGENAFAHCRDLKTVILPKSITKISNSTFQYCSSLTSLSIPNNVIEIGAGTFADCENLSSIDIPEGVEKLGVGQLALGVFERCNNLVSVNLPSSIKEIGHKAFHNCKKLTFITFKSTTPPLITINEYKDKIENDPWYHYHENNPLIENSPIKAIYVPAMSVDNYKNNIKWYEPIWNDKYVNDMSKYISRERYYFYEGEKIEGWVYKDEYGRSYVMKDFYEKKKCECPYSLVKNSYFSSLITPL
ncbi:leucine-rich repeat domain-containing protein [Capnocytophaga sputigena]|uniref:leucine-rich repeat domain-containing protein n=1 Tax=Capnocytophaga sputigena TaxID=1019 RepID=UPI002889074D|nr:leucine-rich repeat domain-containing protein [Capnocytophaga sputigena]